MADNRELSEVLRTQVDLAEALASLGKDMQRAIIRFDADAIASITRRQEELLVPFHRLEAERVRLSGGAPLASGDEAPTPDGLGVLGARLRATGTEILRLSRLNTLLLERSRRYVRETLNILTENSTKQLVDERM
jgi:hypothetical protein